MDGELDHDGMDNEPSECGHCTGQKAVFMFRPLGLLPDNHVLSDDGWELMTCRLCDPPVRLAQ